MTNAELQACESIKGIHREMKKANEPNWEQRRYEIAKYVIPCLMKCYNSAEVAAVAVRIADSLIAELKKENNDKNEKKD